MLVIFELILNPFAGNSGYNIAAIGFWLVTISLIVCAIVESE